MALQQIQQVFIDLKLHDIVIVKPEQLNNELYLHIKQNLKRKIEKKCIDAGYICRINDIVDYKDGYLLPEDFSGSVRFKVAYNAKICVVVPNTQTICKIENIFKAIIKAVNGPIIVLIKFTDINTNLFKINETGNIINTKTNKPLKQDDHIKITIKSKRSYIGDNTIGVIGYIEDIATPEQIKEHMFKEFEDDLDEIKPYVKKNIVMNEDNDVAEEQTVATENQYIMDI